MTNEEITKAFADAGFEGVDIRRREQIALVGYVQYGQTGTGAWVGCVFDAGCDEPARLRNAVATFKMNVEKDNGSLPLNANGST